MDEPLEPNDAVKENMQGVRGSYGLASSGGHARRKERSRHSNVSRPHVPKPVEDMSGRSKLVHGVEAPQRIIESILRVPPPEIPSTQIRLDCNRKVPLTTRTTYPHSSLDQLFITTSRSSFSALSFSSLDAVVFLNAHSKAESVIVPIDLGSASHSLYRNGGKPKRGRDAFSDENAGSGEQQWDCRAIPFRGNAFAKDM